MASAFTQRGYLIYRPVMYMPHLPSITLLLAGVTEVVTSSLNALLGVIAECQLRRKKWNSPEHIASTGSLVLLRGMFRDNNRVLLYP